MNYLIDTQILIWYQLDSHKLKHPIRKLLGNRNNTIVISQISLFEIAIKQKLGKLPELDLPIAMLASLIKQDAFNLLDLQTTHIESYSKIPLVPEHRDPFDRLLLATALSENMAIVSADANFKFYQPQIQLISND
ncbi:MAG: type II toxin-antitoxin system VapC family toxin [Methylovulum sp.]|uniref:type II toxin-antitoxin system VapC family toxin n=1 Tax=Methylovulum sp. TaxID=1916980 RepID=UPI002629B192|nr:type II toxin-antitoxin system VapC family toxin [Methylovulum sp.]MDD2724558.1 type II toxin-antitoxin system VapC family toxin [Methylovulum sp.]MDD5123949.1 type II toxin-antitoxin system VapC family toxin [Methylovulum sp.]